ncbi:succinate dehydrogenase assembly factor 2 [Legionella nagasakiensis]|uniref:FAD assembly factor SdhE n=1 Tax=Legionella nagasakiensis TaxID=535290 RepID=UPI0010549F4B|nr:succinate dehydrogenase assembly factor 2 [Legionella nagasakiensis]
MVSSEKKAKIIWHCRRGMLELDLILSHFMEKQFDLLSDKQIHAFEKLLNCQDPDIHAWLMGYEQPDDKELANIVAIIKLYNNH